LVLDYNIPTLLELGAESLATLCWLIVLLGISQRILNFKNHFIEYASEAALPIYILHQTIIICLGYHIVNTNFYFISKYVLINLLSFILIMAIYDTIVRRIGVLRVLFGMKFKAK
jgi:hypothetical protein